MGCCTYDLITRIVMENKMAVEIDDLFFLLLSMVQDI